jgi:cupin 2 domain-containing protein
MECHGQASEAELKAGLPMTTNLFANLPAYDLPDELFTTLLQAPEVRIERIVSHGHKSPDGFWYDQPTNEWVLVLKGAAKIEFEDGTLEMRPGDYVDIPAHKKHRVAWTTPDEPTIWVAVHYEGPPTE